MTFEEFLAQRTAQAGGLNPYDSAAVGRYAYQAPAAQPVYDWKPLVYSPLGEKPLNVPQGLLDEIMSGRGGGGAYNIGSTSAGASGGWGQGLGQDATSLASKAMAVGNAMPLSAYAQLAALAGRSYMDSRLGGLSAAANKLGASQPLSQMGIGTFSDAYGNVGTYSSPETVAAADRAMFGPSRSTGGGNYGGYGGYGGGIGQSGGNAAGMGSHQA